MSRQDAIASQSVLPLKKHQIKVLLIDDQTIIGEAVRRMLATEEDIVFHYCSDPIQAFQLATEIAPTVILQDLVMPEIDGLLLLRFFRANAATRNIPMIVLSAQEEANLKAEAFAAGANDYLVKLPDPIELIARIRYHSQAYINLLQRDEAYHAMQESEHRLRRVLENMPVMMTAFDAQGNIIVWNRECERVTGYTAEEIIGLPHANSIFYGGLGDVETHLGSQQENNDSDSATQPRRDREWQITCKDGSMKTVVWSDISDRFPIPGWATWGIGVDITSRKRAEIELVKAREAALEAARVKSQFLANMSHEIRTPMNGVLGMAGLIIQTDLNDKQRSYAQTIRTSAQHLLSLINDILDFSKLEAGEMHLETLEFDLYKCVEEVVDLLASQADAKGINLSREFENNLPRLLQGDPVRLRQILLNLVGNAIKFTSVGEVKIQATLQSETNKTALVHFAVIDTGIGIPAEGLQKLFQSFSQVDASTSREYGGTGLGLAICKQLVSLMGGNIGVESVVDRGSTFWFTVPFEKSYSSAVSGQQSAVSGQEEDTTNNKQQTTSKNLKILVAEDNSINQAVILNQLEMLGYQADCVANGLEVLELLTKQDYDLVLMDCQMPLMDGYSTTEELRRREGNKRHTVVIALTANAMLADREKCLAAGMDDYLSKPLEQEDLATVIERWTPEKAEAKTHATDPLPNSSSSAAPQDSSSPIDLERLKRISRGKVAVQQRLIQIFLDTTPKDLAALESAVQALDYSQVQYYGHRLKGSAANLGVSTLSAQAATLETMARQHTLEGAIELLASMWQILEQVQALFLTLPHA